MLRFLTDTAIPPTSNQAERDLRPSKTQQKISGRLRSEKTTRDRYAIRGYGSTAAKHGRQTSPPSATHSPEIPGYHPSQQLPTTPKAITQPSSPVTQAKTWRSPGTVSGAFR